MTRLLLNRSDKPALIGHGRSPYRKSECSSSLRDSYQGPIGGYSGRRSLCGRATDLGLQCLPFSASTVVAAMPFLSCSTKVGGVSR